MTISQEAITAAGNALRHKWLDDYPGVVVLGLDPMDWAQTALEAAAPHIAATERQRVLDVVRVAAGRCTGHPVCDHHAAQIETGATS